MLSYEKGITVLCVFTEGETPIPKKFKIRYENKEVKTVVVDQIRFVEEMFKHGISNHHFIYHCTSEVDDILLNYTIKYFVLDMRWELIINIP